MKTNAGLLEYLVPGVLAHGSFLILLVCLIHPSVEQLALATNYLSTRPTTILVGLGILYFCGAYAMGAIASNLGGRVLKRRVRGVQRHELTRLTQTPSVPVPQTNRFLSLSSGDEIRANAGYLRAYCRTRHASADRQIQFHTEQGRLMRALVIPALTAMFVPWALNLAYNVPNIPTAVVLTLAFFLLMLGAVDSYAYRQRLLAGTTVDYFLALADKQEHISSLAQPVPSGGTEWVVAVDWANSSERRESLGVVHHQGIPHRAVHIEVYDVANNILVWRRADSRLELPGGHVSWGEAGAESSLHAAARELLEELGFVRDGLELEIARIAPKFVHVGLALNRSHADHNIEWVDVYRVNWADLGQPQLRPDAVLSEELNHSARWYSCDAIRTLAVHDTASLNSSLLMFLGRQVGGHTSIRH